MMPTPADVAVRDLIIAILRDKPIYMDAEEISHQLHRETGRELPAMAVWQHCQALWIAGYLHQTQDVPTTWAFIPPAMASQHRRVELHEAREFAALAEIAGDKGRTR